MRISKLLIPVLVLAITASCSSLFSNNEDSNNPHLKIATTQSQSERTTFNGDSLMFDPGFYESNPTFEFPPFKFNKDGEQLIINGYYLSPNGGYKPEAEIDGKNRTITITVQQPEDIPGATYLAVGWFYDLNITNLSKGEYNFEIVHKGDLLRGGIGDQRTVFSETVEIK